MRVRVTHASDLFYSHFDYSHELEVQLEFVITRESDFTNQKTGDGMHFSSVCKMSCILRRVFPHGRTTQKHCYPNPPQAENCKDGLTNRSDATEPTESDEFPIPDSA
jgi:hypothetical protein